ncbi:serpin family protein [Amycolatopsis thermalba]|uniref:Serpin family protein n=1 Tax=Amycolatopsis thermalba TaxID=944492 RepID=A0ABY4NTX3_9PSEU|nr:MULTISPECIES: serpin family protein [Amycolatopsis]UQS23529.1 serpin family protein [Amycolatopsis thermalba]
MTTPEREHLRFSLAVHRVVGGDGGDSVVSPYSIASALGLASQAADGPAAEELLRLLTGGDPDIAKQADLLRAAATLDNTTRQEDPVLAVANTLWAWDQLPVRDTFLADLAGWPGASTKTAPFVADPDRARRAINADVAETTRDLIPELLPPDSVGPDTVASLVNALYLKAAWQHPFRDANTRDEQFHSPAGPRRVKMMRQSEHLGYAHQDGWQVVELPAAGVTATVLLPDGDLADQEPHLDDAKLATLLAAPRRVQLDLRLPKIDLDRPADLTGALKQLGVRTLFEPGASPLGRLTPDPRAFVSAVQHQSVLELDEQGLEGAAATAVMIRTLSMVTPADPVEVRVDRPFLLLVRHARTGVVYFFARVVEP